MPGKNRLKAFWDNGLENKNLPFLIYGIIWAIIHTQMELSFGDDVLFGSVLNGNNFIEWVINKYVTFNSRIITESVLVLIMQFGSLPWKIINLSMMMIIPWCISQIIFEDEATQQENGIIVCLCCVYPFTDMATAGWGATSVNYTWTLATGLFTLYCVHACIEEIHLNNWTKVFGSVAALFAANVEQMACVLVAFTFIALICCKYKKKKSEKFLWIVLTLITIDLLIILLSPARSARFLNEISYSFPSYLMLSMVDKVTIGLTSTMAQFIGRGNWVFLVFSIVLLFSNYCSNNSKACRITASIPMIASVIGFTCDIFPELFPGITKIFYYEAHAQMPDFTPITAMNYCNFEAYIPMAYSIIVMGAILITLVYTFEGNQFILPALIIMAGFCSRMLMAFSPSIYESARRTYLLMYYSFIIVSVMIYKKLKSDRPNAAGKLSLCITVICILPALNNFLQVLSI